MDVTVIGAGIVGLTCALRLAEAGHRVQIVAAELPPDTTSAVAAAIWYPYRAYPDAEVTRWAARTLQVLPELEPAAGVRMRRGRELFRDAAPDPGWRAGMPGLRKLHATELPPGYPDGFALTVPVIDMAVHLRWLTARLSERGVQITRQRIDAIPDVPGDVVVNCAGLGARELADDASLLSVRGQVVVVAQAGIEEWVLDEHGPTYVVPRADTVVLGGTAGDGEEEIRPDERTARAIVARCAELVPAVAGARIVAHRVGLRPARPSVRLERDSRVVHCYGHGGAGVTLSYGCAEDVVALVG